MSKTLEHVKTSQKTITCQTCQNFVKFCQILSKLCQKIRSLLTTMFWISNHGKSWLKALPHLESSSYGMKHCGEVYPFTSVVGKWLFPDFEKPVNCPGLWVFKICSVALFCGEGIFTLHCKDMPVFNCCLPFIVGIS